MIGIFSTSDLTNTIRREKLRAVYQTLNQLLPLSKQIEIKFFFGNPTSAQGRVRLAREKVKYPSDVVMSEQEESRDGGKILEWYRFARQNLYVRHPRKKEWCKRYHYIGKGDDDAIFHLERLSAMLESVEVDGPNYIGIPFTDVFNGFHITGMNGMLQLMSAELVEWIVHSPIPEENLVGVEDIQVGIWMMKSGINIQYVEATHNQFHDVVGTTMHDGYWVRPFSEETVVIHYCKELHIFEACLQGILGNPSSALVTKTDISSTRFSDWQDVTKYANRLQLPVSSHEAKSILIMAERRPQRVFQGLVRLWTETKLGIPFYRNHVPDCLQELMERNQFFDDGPSFVVRNMLQQRMTALGLDVSFNSIKLWAPEIVGIMNVRPLIPGEFDLYLMTNHVTEILNKLGLKSERKYASSIASSALSGSQGFYAHGELDRRVLATILKEVGEVVNPLRLADLAKLLSDIVHFNKSCFFQN
ncbi:hypothetical protein BC830DRAFT_473311 [Chytriomyces sp. MP71]|nr:hypothetical protein BC830DRAFT_473311 [Chytriomyces sp. MP71]